MLVRSLAAALLATTMTSASLAAQSPTDLVNRAIAAMGGDAALRGLTAVQYDFQQYNLSVGQSELHESPPRATIATGKAWHDYAGGRRALQAENRALTGVVTRQRISTTAAAGVNEVFNAQGSTQNPVAPGARNGQMRTMRIQPERLLLAMAENPGALSTATQRNLRGQMADGVRYTGQDTVSMFFDRATGLPLMFETVTDDPILGDRATQTWLTRWTSTGGVKFARQVDVMWNGTPAQQVYYNNVAVNPALPDSVFAVPDSIARRAQPAPATAAPPAQAVTMNQLGPSVWRAEGGTHFTLVIEQPDQVVLVEAPQSTERVRAVLDTVRGRFPGKRVGVVAMTHYHWDHSGGIREIVAENIPLATLPENAAFVRQVAAARRSVRPDNQAQRRRNPTLRTFTDSLVIGSGESMVVLYRQPTTHAEGLLTAWVPSARVLFTSDVVNPGAQGQVPPLGSAELVALARARGLSPERYAGGHGTVVPWPAIETAAATNP